MHRDYEDDRSYRRPGPGGEPDADVELWGRQMDRDDWERGTYGRGTPARGSGREYQAGRRPPWRRRDLGYRPSAYDPDWDIGPGWGREDWQDRRWSGDMPLGRYEVDREPRWERGRDWGFGVRGPDWDRPMDERRYDNGPRRWGSGEYASHHDEGSSHWHGRTSMRGYQRSDDRIREEVCDRLNDHPAIDTSDLEIAVSDGEVTLTGTVDDRWEKRMAEDLAEQVPGVRDVQNHLRIGSQTRNDVEIPTGTTRVRPATAGRDVGGQVAPSNGSEMTARRR